MKGGRGSDEEGVKDGGRLEKKGGLLLLHFAFGNVSDWYFLWLKERGGGGLLLG